MAGACRQVLEIRASGQGPMTFGWNTQGPAAFPGTWEDGALGAGSCKSPYLPSG